MLHWRIILGLLFVAVIAALAWADFDSTRPGLIMSPLAIVGSFLAAGELVRLFESTVGATSPSRYLVVPGSVLTVLVSCMPMLWPIGAVQPTAVTGVGWVGVGLAASCSLVFCAEMYRFRGAGAATVRLALAVFGIAYAGGLMGFVAHLRLLSGGPWGENGRWGMVALISLIVVVKTNDIGAYFVGRFLGRTKMAPVLSPKKTWEGVAGGFAVSTLATAATLGPLAASMGCVTDQTTTAWLLGCLAYALLVGAAGVAGDLAVSLLKRDANLKNSSSWMPGFGGVLDLLDSVLFAAPVALLMWLSHAVGP